MTPCRGWSLHLGSGVGWRESFTQSSESGVGAFIEGWGWGALTQGWGWVGGTHSGLGSKETDKEILRGRRDNHSRPGLYFLAQCLLGISMCPQPQCVPTVKVTMTTGLMLTTVCATALCQQCQGIMAVQTWAHCSKTASDSSSLSEDSEISLPKTGQARCGCSPMSPLGKDSHFCH